MAKQKTPKVWWKDTEVGSRYGVHRVTVWRWVREGRFPPPHQVAPNTSRWHNDAIISHDAGILGANTEMD